MLKYPQFSEHRIWKTLPMMQGLAYLTVAYENDGWRQFCGMQRTSPGYVSQEIQKLMSVILDAKG